MALFGCLINLGMASFRIVLSTGSQTSQNNFADFVVAPCISNIKQFIVQLMHTNYKILRLLKQLKL